MLALWQKAKKRIAELKHEYFGGTDDQFRRYQRERSHHLEMANHLEQSDTGFGRPYF